MQRKEAVKQLWDCPPPRPEDLPMDETFYRSLLDHLHDGLYFVDCARRITYWNRGAEQLTGYMAHDILGSSCADNILNHVTSDGVELCHGGCPLAATMADGQPREADVYLHHRDGHRLPVHVRVSPIRDGAGMIVGAAEIFSDNTWKEQTLRRLEELERLALLDHLTRLANRRYLETALVSRLAEANRYGWGLALLMIDIDHFKRINDTHGHDVGDRVLRMIANTLRAAVRPFDAVGRWGGEEFALAAAQADASQAWAIGDRVRALVEQSSLTAPSGTVSVTVSVGAALAAPNDTLESLFLRADRALYRSKEQGRNRVTLAPDR